jgi:uncharacterized protein YggU (UPF0235/DUF167 family)
MDPLNIKINCKVIAKSSQSTIKKDASNSLKVYVRSARENGKANDEVFTLIKKTFKPAKFQVCFILGEFATKKILQLSFDTLNDYHVFLGKLGSLESS